MAREITIKVGLDDSEVNAKAQGVGRKIKAGLEPAQASVNALRSATSGLTSALTALGGALAFRQIAQMGIELDKVRNTMVALTGSTEAANKKLAELRKLAAASPGVTNTLATQLFNQLKATREVADKTINELIKSIGKLNTVFTIPDPAEFTRNLTQIFKTAFERDDIKQALNQVPIFEQLLESAFGTSDPDKLRKLKQAGVITGEPYFAGLNEAINKRFPDVQESLGGKLQKALDETRVKLAELGERLLRDLIPILEKLLPILNSVLGVFERLPTGIQAATLATLAFAPAISSLAGAIGGLKGVAVALGGFLLSPAGLAVLGVLGGAAGITVATLELEDLINKQIPRNVEQRLNPQGLQIGPNGLPIIPGADLKFQFGGRSAAAAATPKSQLDAVRAAAAALKTAAKGKAGRGRTGIDFPSLSAEDLVSSQFEGEEEFAARAAAIARGRDTRRALTLQLGQADDAAFVRQRLEQGRLSRAALTFEFEQAEKAQKALAKNEQLLSNSARFMKGFAEATLSVGDAFDRFGASVAHAFGNVRDLFNGLKQAVFGFFNDLVGSALQGLVRQTLGPLLGSAGNLFGGGISAPASASGGGLARSFSSAFGGGGGIGSIFSGGGGGGTGKGGG